MYLGFRLRVKEVAMVIVPATSAPGVQKRSAKRVAFARRANLLLADLCSAHPCAEPLRGLRANLLLADLCRHSKSFASLRFWTPGAPGRKDDQGRGSRCPSLKHATPFTARAARHGDSKFKSSTAEIAEKVAEGAEKTPGCRGRQLWERRPLQGPPQGRGLRVRATATR